MLKKKLFTAYKLDAERNKESVVTPIRLNNFERAMVKEIKELLNIHSDSKALKVSARIGLDVLQRTFSKKTLKYLCKENRERLTDYKDFIKSN